MISDPRNSEVHRMCKLLASLVRLYRRNEKEKAKTPALHAPRCTTPRHLSEAPRQVCLFRTVVRSPTKEVAMAEALVNRMTWLRGIDKPVEKIVKKTIPVIDVAEQENGDCAPRRGSVFIRAGSLHS